MSGRPFRILCLGEILFDIYPDAKQLGGAPFNVAFHLSQLQQDVAFASRIGSDENGRAISKALMQREFPVEFIQHDDFHQTGRVMVQLDSAGVPCFEIVDDVAYDFIAAEQNMLTYLDKGIDLLYFGTLAQRSSISRQTIQTVLTRRPKEALALYDVNLRQQFFTRDVVRFSFEHSDLVKLNEEELRQIQALFALPSAEADAAQELIVQFRLKSLCVTKGPHGSVLYLAGQDYHLSEPNEKQTVILDTLGAGDAFTAIYALGTLLDWSGEEILARASRFATAVCGFKGAIPAQLEFYDHHFFDISQTTDGTQARADRQDTPNQNNNSPENL